MRAPIIRSSSPAKMKPSANAPRSSDSAALTASTGLMPCLQQIVDQVQHDLGIGFGLERPSLLLERFAQLAKVLDDAVVDHGDAIGRVRMRVVLGRLAVGGPAGVPDPVWPAERFGIQPLFEILQLALGAAALEVTAFQRGDAGGIIAAIFKPLEWIHQLLRDRSASQNADNAAHAVQYPKSTRSGVATRDSLNENAVRQILNNYCGLRQS